MTILYRQYDNKFCRYPLPASPADGISGNLTILQPGGIMAQKRLEKRKAKRAEKRIARHERRGGEKRTTKTRQAISKFIVNKRSIVPNIITMSNMTMGFFAIILASRGDDISLALAGIMIFIGTLFDGIDGAVARAMHVESPVGVQLDSLADGIAYGIAPAVIAYNSYLKHLSQNGLLIDSGMLIAVIYPICAIYRLARFNIGAADDDHTGFCGLPSPAAGIIIACVPVLKISTFMPLFPFTITLPWPVFVSIYVIVGLLMVTRIDYSKVFTVIARKGKVFLVMSLILIILGVALFSVWAVFGALSIYAVSGILIYIVRLFMRKKRVPQKG